LNLAADTTLAGSGQTVLTDATYSAISTNGGVPMVLTIAQGHTLRGSGYVGAGISNRGAVIADGVLSVNGGGNFDNSGGLVQVADSGMLFLLGGTFSGGAVQGLGASSRLGGNGTFRDIALSGQFLVTPRDEFKVSGTLTNTGTLTIAGSSQGTAALNLAADTTLAGSGQTVLTDATYSSISTNLGASMVLTVAQGHTLRGSGYVAAGLVNLGTLTAGTGDALSILSSLRNGGQLRIDAGGMLDAIGGLSVIVQDETSAVTTVNGLLKAATFRLEAGVLEGDGTVQADIVNLGGTIAAGNSPGALTIDGDLTLGDESLLLVEVRGTVQGVQYDWVHVNGDLMLGGALQIDFGSYLPRIGEEYSFLTSSAGHVSGAFDSITAAGYGLSVRYGASGITATVTAVPEPASYGLMLVGFGLLALRLRQRVASC
jgi:fibronectin-binding autotransporter adhesin